MSSEGRRKTSWVCATLLLSCSAETTGLSGEAIPLLIADFSPGCFRDRKLVPPPFGSDRWRTDFLARGGHLAYLAREAALATELVTGPIVAEPELGRWTADIGDSRFSAWVLEVIEGGEFWIRAELEYGAAPNILGATIRTRRGRTYYEFDAFEHPVVVYPHGFRYGPVRRGCDPQSGTSFDVRPEAVADGIFQDALTCWNAAGESLEDERECSALATQVVPED